MPGHDGRIDEGFICWADLAATDVGAAERFYGAVLGWQFRATGEEFGGYRIATRDGKQAAGVGPVQDGAPPVWTLYFAVDDVDDFTRRARDLGGNVLNEPFEVPSQGRMSVIADPTGAAFGAWQAIEHHGFGRMESPGFFAWCEVNTTDAARARDFYAQLLEATYSETPNPATTYYVLDKGGHNIAGILQMTKEWAGIPPHWMPYFQVDDIDGAVARAKEHGGTVAVGPFDTPYGRIAVVGDPAMAYFSLMQP